MRIIKCYIYIYILYKRLIYNRAVMLNMARQHLYMKSEIGAIVKVRIFDFYATFEINKVSCRLQYVSIYLSMLLCVFSTTK